jgi:hypothetical protein
MSTTIEELIAQRPAADFPVELGDEEIAEFRERGFTSIARITSDEELAWLAEVYDWLFSQRVQPVPGGYFDLSRPYDSPGEDRLPQIITPETRVPELRKTAFWRNGRALASRLLGVETSALRGWGHMIRKPARVGEALPWHQDEAYWDPAFEYKALGCWMPLDAATHETGCMSFIPGSHLVEVRVHRHVGDDPAVHALVTDDVDPKIAIAVPIGAGGAIFHHCRILHSSAPNRSPNVRRAYANEWQLPPAKRVSPAPDRPWIAEGKQAWEARGFNAPGRPVGSTK